MHVVIPRRSFWRFFDQDHMPENWAHPDFQDQSWQVGQGPFAYLGTPERWPESDATPLLDLTHSASSQNHGTEISYHESLIHCHQKRPAAFFRKSFDLPELTRVHKLTLTLCADDGYILYINGVKVEENNIQAGSGHERWAECCLSKETLDYSDKAPAPAALFKTITLPKDLLQHGANSIAVSVHAASPQERWVYFDASLAIDCDLVYPCMSSMQHRWIHTEDKVGLELSVEHPEDAECSWSIGTEHYTRFHETHRFKNHVFLDFTEIARCNPLTLNLACRLQGLSMYYQVSLDRVVLLPQPQHLQCHVKPYVAKIQEPIHVIWQGVTKDIIAQDILQQRLQDLGAQLVQDHDADGSTIVIANALPVNCSIDNFDLDACGDEGYWLKAEGQTITIISPTQKGRFYGMMTLVQLLQATGSTLFATGCTIFDKPRFKVRMTHFCLGQASYSVNLLRRMIRILARFKINEIQLHEGDDWLNGVRYTNNKLGSLNPNAIPIAEIKKLIDYAKDHHIHVGAKYEYLGHSAAKVFHYPEIRSGSTSYGTNLCVIHPKTFELFESMTREWLEICTSDYFQVGFTEGSVAVGQEAQAQQLEGYDWPTDKLADQFILKIDDILYRLMQAYNKKLHLIFKTNPLDGPPAPDTLKSPVVFYPYNFLNYYGECPQDMYEHDVRKWYENPDNTLLMCSAQLDEGKPWQPYLWCRMADAYDNIIGIINKSWRHNDVDSRMQGIISGAVFSWNPTGIDYLNFDKRYAHLKTIYKDINTPNPADVDRKVRFGFYVDDHSAVSPTAVYREGKGEFRPPELDYVGASKAS